MTEPEWKTDPVKTVSGPAKYIRVRLGQIICLTVGFSLVLDALLRYGTNTESLGIGAVFVAAGLALRGQRLRAADPK